MNTDNLRKLAVHLLTVKSASFDMRDFSDVAHYKITPHNANSINMCGTAACAVGHATTVIPVDSADFSDGRFFSWNTYSERMSGLGIDDWRWDFMFMDGWSSINNTPEFASYRIKLLLDNPSLDEVALYDLIDNEAKFPLDTSECLADYFFIG